MDVPIPSRPVARAGKGWLDDLLASVVVFMVALPLCMGIALASGAPTSAGLITGIIAGLIVGCISGSPLQVSGPAAGLCVVVFELLQHYRAAYLARVPDLDTLGPTAQRVINAHAYDYALMVLGVVVALAGLIQLIAGVLRLGQWFRAVSPAVIQGMLSGIGVLIFAGQFHVMIDDQAPGGGFANLAALPAALVKGLLPAEGNGSHRAAFGIGVFTIAAMIAWKRLAPRRIRFLPAPLIGVLAATVLTAAVGFDVRHVVMPENLASSLHLPTDEWPEVLGQGPVWVAAVTMALIASAETLLCAAAVDKMHQGPRTQYDRELAAQGLGNLLCGSFGGLPMTGVIVRSAANLEAGGRTRLSAVLHGFWLLALTACVPFLLEWIPTASLAAVLVITGYKLVDVYAVRALWKAGRGEVAIYAVTLGLIVATNLLEGVLVGIALSALKLLLTFARLRVRLEDDPQLGRSVLHLRGTATFLRLPKLAATLEKVRPSTELHVRLDRLDYIDHACLDLLMGWEKQHQATGGSLVIDWETLTARFKHPKRRRAPA
jgi:MFS superfamily sulfate permease-like transporter